MAKSFDAFALYFASSPTICSFDAPMSALSIERLSTSIVCFWKIFSMSFAVDRPTFAEIVSASRMSAVLDI